MEDRGAFVPLEVLRDRLAPFLSYRELFNLSLTCREMSKQFKKRAIKNLRKDCEEAFPLSLLTWTVLTGGFLLSLLTGKKFLSPNVDLVVDYSTEDDAKLFATTLDIFVEDTLKNLGWVYISQKPKEGIYRACKIYAKHGYPGNIHLYIPFHGEMAKDLIDSHSMSISRIWFDGTELALFDMENSLNLNNHGYKAFIMDYEAEDSAIGQNMILAMEKKTSLQQTKYLLRGYLVGLFPEEEEEEEEEEETIVLAPRPTHGQGLLTV